MALVEAVVFALLVLSLCLISTRSWASVKLPRNLPWIGRERGLFSKLRSNITSARTFDSLLAQAYEQYDKKNQSCILPNVAGEGVLLPSSLVSWVGGQPETLLAARVEHRAILQASYTFPKSMLGDRVGAIEEAARKYLTRQVNAFNTGMLDEISTSLDELFGTDTEEWKEVCVESTCTTIMGRTMNRMTVGLPLCRNKEYLSVGESFTQAIGLASLLIRPLPRFIKPVLGPLLALPCHYQYRRSLKFLGPLIQSRLSGEQHQAPQDFIQFCIDNANSGKDSPSELTSEIIRGRLLVLNFAGIHTSTFTMTNVLLSLNDASSTSKGYMSAIHEEVTRVLNEENGVWTKAGLARMIRLDSAIRESMRLDTFSPRISIRKVVAEHGITFPSGLHIAKGNQIGLNTYGVHHDPDLYPNPDEYDAFRFSRQREDIMSGVCGTGNDDKTSTSTLLASKNLSLVTTSPRFLGFGHGRFACPGRFFAASAMKFFLALVVLRYDVEPLGCGRPGNTWFGETVIAPRKAKLRVRRRVG